MHGWNRVLRPVLMALAAWHLGCGGAEDAAAGPAQPPPTAAPSITRFAATFTSTRHGGFATLTPEFTGGTGAIEPKVGPVTSGEPVSTVYLADTTAFTLTVTSAAGARVSKTVTVTPQAEENLFSYWGW